MKKICTDRTKKCWNDACRHKITHEGDDTCNLPCDYATESHPCIKISEYRKTKLLKIDENA